MVWNKLTWNRWIAYRFNSWRLLVAPTSTKIDAETRNDAKVTDTQWQTTFTNLCVLQVAIRFDSASEGLYGHLVGCLASQNIDACIHSSHTHLRTMKVTVKFDGLSCGGYSTATKCQDGEACPHGCAEKIAKGFERLVEIKT